MNEDARCTEPPTQSNARGAQNAPAAPRRASYRGTRSSPYDPATGKLTWGDASDPRS